MIKHFTWSDYDLTGPLVLNLGDYTTKAYGCERIIDDLLSSLMEIQGRRESIRWILMDYWGRGKSTLMYNFCHKINENLFFGSDSPQTLALYVNYPRKPKDLLDYTYENGLPVPWTPTIQKNELVSLRRDLFATASRRLAYAWVRKAIISDASDSSKTKFGSEEFIYNNLARSIKYLDSLHQRHKSYLLLEGILRSFLDSFKRMNSEVMVSNQSVRYLPGLLYPESSPEFLESYFRLFSEPRKGLRNFLEFFTVCELADIHILIIIDEAEDWNQMARSRLDDFLIDILPTNRLSVVLILRTEVMNKLRGIQKKLRYLVVRSWMKRSKHIPDPRPVEILEMAKGILSTCRTDRSLKLFPFTDDYILALSNFTIRGRHFNPRMFIRCLDKTLRLSLEWTRNGPQIDAEFIKRPDLIDAVAEDFRIEEKKELESSVLDRAEEIQRKMQSAREVCDHLLIGRVNPPTRYMLEIVKKVIADRYQIPPPSDIEVIAYSERRYRAKVTRIIRELEETPKPNDNAIRTLKWFFLQQTKN